MVKIYKNFVYLLLFFILLVDTIFCSQAGQSTFSVAALTWNVGNKTAKDNIVEGLSDEIEKLGSPDVIVVGTQEELAKNGEELKDKLLLQFGKNAYHIAAENAHITSAGANNSGKTLALAASQSTPLSKRANLPQNRCTLAVFVKKGITLTDIKKRIDYPPGKKQSNNAFILIEGNLTRKGEQRSPLPISVASVHLNSRNDGIRRQHANYFFDNQGFTDTEKTYDDILKEAKRFHLIMGDFNERDYLMKDDTVADRGYLTNFPGYGYDFSTIQGRKSPVPVYGTYGYTKLHNTIPEALPDPRGRVHNAKGGFLDRIVVTSGFPIASASDQYGALITDPREFDPKHKFFYSGSDHLPIIRAFKVSVPSSNENEDIVKNYIERRLPNFEPEIEDIKEFIKDKTLEGIKSRAENLMFYDSKESPDDFLKKFSNLRTLTTALGGKLMYKKNDLETLQNQVESLKEIIDESHDPQFLSTVYNKITDCNKSRNLSLEKIDDRKAPITWYFPYSLSQGTFEGYKNTLTELNGYSPKTVVTQTPKEPAQKKKGFFQRQAGKLKGGLEQAKKAAEKTKGVVKGAIQSKGN